MSLVDNNIGEQTETDKQMLYQELIRVLKSPSTERTTEDIKILSTYFSDIKFFADCKSVLKPDQYTRILKAIEYERVDKNKYLFHKGDRGNKFYVILKGHTNVVIPRPSTVPIKLTKAYQRHIVRVLQHLQRGVKAVSSPFKQLRVDLDSPTKKNTNAKRRQVIDPYVSAQKHIETIEQALENLSNEKVEEMDKERLNIDYEELKEMTHPQMKISKAKAIMGFFLNKVWLEESRIKKDDKDIKFYANYSKKLYWHNLFLCGLRNVNIEFFHKLFQGQMKVFEYSKGGYFGEVAILEDGKRAAGIYCDEDCDFAVISKKYEDDFLFLYRAQNKEKEMLIRTFKPFNWWVQNDQLKGILRYLKETTRFPKGNFIYRRGNIFS